jgi:putative nucleotidyltransferase with HDIG domain
MAMARAICEKDHATGAHCMWVGWLSAEIGRRLSMSPDEIEELRTAGILHDIGKIGVPDAILLKPGPLSTGERQVIDRHAEIGADLVARHHAGVAIRQAIRFHHDWYDGRRSASRRIGNDLPWYARILAVADAFQSMVEERPYRASRPPTEAIEELRRGSGTQFDPFIVEVLAEILDEAQAHEATHGSFRRQSDRLAVASAAGARSS